MGFIHDVEPSGFTRGTERDGLLNVRGDRNRSAKDDAGTAKRRGVRLGARLFEWGKAMPSARYLSRSQSIAAVSQHLGTAQNRASTPEDQVDFPQVLHR